MRADLARLREMEPPFLVAYRSISMRRTFSLNEALDYVDEMRSVIAALLHDIAPTGDTWAEGSSVARARNLLGIPNGQALAEPADAQGEKEE